MKEWKNLIVLMVCSILFAAIILAEDSDAQEEKLIPMEITGTIIKCDSVGTKEKYHFHLQINDNDIVRLPQKIGEKEFDFGKFVDKKVIVKGNGNYENAYAKDKDKKIIEYKVPNIAQLISIELQKTSDDSEKKDKKKELGNIKPD